MDLLNIKHDDFQKDFRKNENEMDLKDYVANLKEKHDKEIENLKNELQ